ncbi:MAG: paraquat-inducible protein A, partial [Neisseriaceae bacterium]|nr:paraquat-inducible protein A [Neisseriaceae bacterium]
SATIYFTLVVVLTMFSAYFFDTRLLWEKEKEMKK